MIRRLRPPHDGRRLAELYATPHQHTRWPDHVARVEATIVFARDFAPDPTSVADLSCGDGAIALALSPSPILGDFAPGWPVTGPLERTLPQLEPVDLYVCCETLEHVERPAWTLDAIRAVARRLVLSTPVAGEDGDNEEHYWAWDREGVEALLAGAGWQVDAYVELDPGAQYVFGVWGCS